MKTRREEKNIAVRGIITSEGVAAHKQVRNLGHRATKLNRTKRGKKHHLEENKSKDHLVRIRKNCKAKGEPATSWVRKRVRADNVVYGAKLCQVGKVMVVA